ncbi:MAG: DEAD/DEAH box helicase family protein, partial [Candidatus Omnitrophica bacterium]|nr:DEAD/DEAH box helicase family protein [Candidatus Omnitrophota bacterium]
KIIPALHQYEWITGNKREDQEADLWVRRYQRSPDGACRVEWVKIQLVRVPPQARYRAFWINLSPNTVRIYVTDKAATADILHELFAILEGTSHKFNKCLEKTWMPISFRRMIWRAALRSARGGDHSAGATQDASAAAAVVLPKDLAQAIAKNPEAFCIINNHDQLSDVRVKTGRALAVKGQKAPLLEATTLDCQSVEISGTPQPVTQAGRTFFKEFLAAEGTSKTFVLILDEAQYKKREKHPLVPYLQLVPHMFYSLGPVEEGKMYCYVVTKNELLALRTPAIRQYLAVNGRAVIQERVAYKDAVLCGAQLVSGRLIPKTGFKLFEKFLRANPALVIVGAAVGPGGNLNAGWRAPIFQGKKELVGKELTIISSQGEAYRVLSEKGDTVYTRPDEDTEDAVFEGGEIVNGQRVGGRFVGAYPSRLYASVVTSYKKALICNVRCDKNGGLWKVDRMFWKQRRGYENYSGITMVWEEGRITHCYDKEGTLLWADASVQDLGWRTIRVGAEYRDGKVQGGEIVFSAETGIQEKILRQYPDCIISNLNAAVDKGDVKVAGEHIPCGEKYIGQKGFVAVREQGRFVYLYDRDGNVVYSDTPQSRNAVFTFTYFKDGKFCWGGFYKAFPFAVSSDVPMAMPNCAIVNVAATPPRGTVQVAHNVFAQGTIILENRKDLARIFRDSKPLAVCDLEGNVLYVVNPERMAELEAGRVPEVLGKDAILNLLRNFGLAHGVGIICRLTGVRSQGAREILLKYTSGLLTSEEKGKQGGVELNDLPRFLKTTAEELAGFDLQPDTSGWLVDVLIERLYPLLSRNGQGLALMEKEAADPATPAYLQVAYRAVVKYYRNLEFFAAPQGLREPLHPYQKDAVKFIHEKKCVLLADECGLGKTFTAIASALPYCRRRAGRVLVICSKSAMGWWKEEILAKTDLTAQDVFVWGEEGNDPVQLTDSPIIIVNYEAIRGRKSQVLDRLTALGYRMVIADEAHRLRNESLQTEAVLAFNAESKLLLTATPLVGRKVKKLFFLLHWLQPHLFPSRMKFIQRYAQDPLALRQAIAPFMLCRLKSDVGLDLPPKDISRQYVSLVPEDRALYDELSQNFAIWLERHGLSLDRQMLAKLEKLREAAISRHIVGSELSGTGLVSGKYQRALELVNAALLKGEKAVVFTRYKTSVRHLKEILARAHPGAVVTITGEQQAAERGQILRRFHEDPACKILIATYGVAGESLNLQVASTAIFVDFPWTYQELIQAIDRLHRIGQTKAVSIFLIAARDTIDEHMLNVLAQSEWLHRLFLKGETMEDADQEEIIATLQRTFKLKKETALKAHEEFVAQQAGLLAQKAQKKTERPRDTSGIDPSVSAAVVFDDRNRELVEWTKRNSQESRLGELTPEERAVVEDVLRGWDLAQLTGRYHGQWVDILKSALMKMGIVEIKLLPATYPQFRKTEAQPTTPEPAAIAVPAKEAAPGSASLPKSCSEIFDKLFSDWFQAKVAENSQEEKLALGKIRDFVNADEPSAAAVLAWGQGQLNFEDHSAEQTFRNSAVIWVFAQLSEKYKTVELARQLSKLLDHQGAQERALRDAGKEFFASISDQLVFEPVKETVAPDTDTSEWRDIDIYYAEIRRHPRVTVLGEVALGALARLGDTKARDAMSTANLGLVVARAKVYKKWTRLSLMDLIGQGNEGLLIAIDKWEPQQGFQFSTYATYWIDQRIRRYITERKAEIRVPVDAQ